MEKSFLQRISGSVIGKIRHHLLEKKMVSPAGIVILPIITVMMAYSTVPATGPEWWAWYWALQVFFFCVLRFIYPSLILFSLFGLFFRCFRMVSEVGGHDTHTGLIPNTSLPGPVGYYFTADLPKEITREFSGNRPLQWLSGVVWLFIVAVLDLP